MFFFQFFFFLVQGHTFIVLYVIFFIVIVQRKQLFYKVISSISFPPTFSLPPSPGLSPPALSLSSPLSPPPFSLSLPPSLSEGRRLLEVGSPPRPPGAFGDAHPQPLLHPGGGLPVHRPAAQQRHHGKGGERRRPSTTPRRCDTAANAPPPRRAGNTVRGHEKSRIFLFASAACSRRPVSEHARPH